MVTNTGPDSAGRLVQEFVSCVEGPSGLGLKLVDGLIVGNYRKEVPFLR